MRIRLDFDVDFAERDVMSEKEALCFILYSIKDSVNDQGLLQIHNCLIQQVYENEE